MKRFLCILITLCFCGLASSQTIIPPSGGASSALPSGSITTGTANIYPSSDGTNTGTKVQHFYLTLTGTGTFLPPPGSWNDGDKLTLVIYTAGIRTVDFTNACWNAVGTVKPTATVATKFLYVGCVYNANIVSTYHASATWDIVAVSQQ